jgi:nucleoside-diphosphate-sugar epimerase
VEFSFDSRFNTCVIFGGTGFIGSHLAMFLLRHNSATKVILADLSPPRPEFVTAFSDHRLEVCKLDVRDNYSTWSLPSSGIDLIVNLAAIHREPGHLPHEYYETNLPGADNVCAYAEYVNCLQIIFTSSIAPYGPTESVKTEQSIPTPVSAYGGSKLVAEAMHVSWQRAGLGRRLVIVRPGVVFGPGERGNVTRLIQATIRGYFLYMGNRQTRKAAGYVKELILSMIWMLDKLPLSGGFILYNFGMQDPPSVQDFVQTALRVIDKRRFVPSLPYRFVLILSYFLDSSARFFGIRHPFSPVRIKKLIRSNNIQPRLLLELNYPYQFTLHSAMQDWMLDSPSEWS